MCGTSGTSWWPCSRWADRYVGQELAVSGPRLLSFREAVGEIAAATGGELTYLPVTARQYGDQLAGFGCRHRRSSSSSSSSRACSTGATPTCRRVCGRFWAGAARFHCVRSGGGGGGCGRGRFGRKPEVRSSGAGGVGLGAQFPAPLGRGLRPASRPTRPHSGRRRCSCGGGGCSSHGCAGGTSRPPGAGSATSAPGTRRACRGRRCRRRSAASAGGGPRDELGGLLLPRRSLAARAAAVATDGHTRSMAALTAAPTSTANADTPIHSSTATGRGQRAVDRGPLDRAGQVDPQQEAAEHPHARARPARPGMSSDQGERTGTDTW